MYKIVSKYAKSLKVGDTLVDFGSTEPDFDKNLNSDKTKLKSINLSLISPPYFAYVSEINNNEYTIQWDNEDRSSVCTLEQLSSDLLGWGNVIVISKKDFLFMKLKYSNSVVD
jgi:hypothetical protein